MSSAVTGGDFARKVVDKLLETAKDRGQKIAEQWGTPLDGQAPTRDQQIRLWNYMRPEAQTPEGQAQAAALLAAGRTREAVNWVFPWRLDRTEVDPMTGEAKQFRGLIGSGDIKTRIDRAQQFASMSTVEVAPDAAG